MIRLLLIFVIAAGLGAVGALALRSALHQPYAAATEPAPTPSPAAPVKPASDPHAGHTSAPSAKPVNDICAICGMKADPRLTATYQGKLIAFGCKGCPEKFAKDPDRYGPYFLKNTEAP